VAVDRGPYPSVGHRLGELRLLSCCSAAVNRVLADGVVSGGEALKKSVATPQLGTAQLTVGLFLPNGWAAQSDRNSRSNAGLLPRGATTSLTQGEIFIAKSEIINAQGEKPLAD
jgi:hypothetical protein